jgi:NAD(P)-dependent dehydrogenase (short-subunit alcohol dehydrogenase family)
MKLSDKIIIVTGGMGLLGKEFVSDIKKRGGIPINLDINNKNDLANGHLHFDINEDNSIDIAIQSIMKKFGRIDGLVNNAYPRTSDFGNNFERTSSKSFSKNIDMQLARIFSVSKPVLEIMKNQKSGSIVNIASIYGIVSSDFTIYEGTKMTSPVAYSAIKGGLISLSRYFCSYFGKYNIRSNSVSPGGIFDNQDKVFVKNYENKAPLRRMGNPHDISPIVSFLLSDDSKYISGQNIAVDGGWTAI